jgi:hypothetical protein
MMDILAGTYSACCWGWSRYCQLYICQDTTPYTGKSSCFDTWGVCQDLAKRARFSFNHIWWWVGPDFSPLVSDQYLGRGLVYYGCSCSRHIGAVFQPGTDEFSSYFINSWNHMLSFQKPQCFKKYRLGKIVFLKTSWHGPCLEFF